MAGEWSRSSHTYWFEFLCIYWFYNLIGALMLGSNLPYFLRKTSFLLFPTGRPEKITKEDFYNRLIDGVLYSKKKNRTKKGWKPQRQQWQSIVVFPWCFLKYVSSIHYKCSSLTFYSKTADLLETGDLFRPICVKGLFIDEVWLRHEIFWNERHLSQ